MADEGSTRQRKKNSKKNKDKPKDRIEHYSSEAKHAMRKWLVTTSQEGIHQLRLDYAELKTFVPPDNEKKAFDANIRKCRYKDVKCLDKTRVLLKWPEGVEGDFIHANWVRHELLENDFICCQAPMEATVSDFWRMIWQEKVKQIIMLCKTVEDGKSKCSQYWPREKDDSMEHFGLKIRTVDVDEGDSDIIYTRMELTYKEEVRHVDHRQWVSWPDRSVPKTPMTPFRLLQIPRQFPKNPTVVHCSAGIGRTGTLVMIEMLLNALKRGKKPKFREYVKEIRCQRAQVVQTEDQYLYVHYAIAQFLYAKNVVSGNDIRGFCAEYENYLRLLNANGGKPLAVDATSPPPSGTAIKECEPIKDRTDLEATSTTSASSNKGSKRKGEEDGGDGSEEKSIRRKKKKKKDEEKEEGSVRQKKKKAKLKEYDDDENSKSTSIWAGLRSMMSRIDRISRKVSEGLESISRREVRKSLKKSMAKRGRETKSVMEKSYGREEISSRVKKKKEKRKDKDTNKEEKTSRAKKKKEAKERKGGDEEEEEKSARKRKKKEKEKREDKDKEDWKRKKKDEEKEEKEEGTSKREKKRRKKYESEENGGKEKSAKKDEKKKDAEAEEKRKEEEAKEEEKKQDNSLKLEVLRMDVVFKEDRGVDSEKEKAKKEKEQGELEKKKEKNGEEEPEKCSKQKEESNQECKKEQDTTKEKANEKGETNEDTITAANEKQKESKEPKEEKELESKEKMKQELKDLKIEMDEGVDGGISRKMVSFPSAGLGLLVSTSPNTTSQNQVPSKWSEQSSEKKEENLPGRSPAAEEKPVSSVSVPVKEKAANSVATSVTPPASQASSLPSVNPVQLQVVSPVAFPSVVTCAQRPPLISPTTAPAPSPMPFRSVTPVTQPVHITRPARPWTPAVIRPTSVTPVEHNPAYGGLQNPPPAITSRYPAALIPFGTPLARSGITPAAPLGVTPTQQLAATTPHFDAPPIQHPAITATPRFGTPPVQHSTATTAPPHLGTPLGQQPAPIATPPYVGAPPFPTAKPKFVYKRAKFYTVQQAGHKQVMVYQQGSTAPVATPVQGTSGLQAAANQSSKSEEQEAVLPDAKND